ncbi:MAG: ABC transporter permease [Armatimonadetes bacterium]|nr:ABC transporter permease [Armatimonadota bacterium]
MPYVFRRVLAATPTLIGVITLAFLLIHIAPGSPEALVIGDYVNVSKEFLAQVRTYLGLDQPLYMQYLIYFGNILRGNLGQSFRTQQPVMGEITSQIPATMMLAAAGVALAVLFGIPAGVISALRRNTWIDYLSMTLAMVWLSGPSFWLAVLLLYFFSFRLGWLPFFGAGTPGDVGSMLRHLVLPAVAIGIRSAALIARMTRSSLLEVMGQDYIRTARAKGVAEPGVVRRHAMRNAAIPIATVVGLDMAYLLGGAVVVEYIFARPGLGKLLVDAIYARDYPVVQGTILIFAFGIIMVNIMVDLAYALLDPKIRFG